MMMAGMDIE